MQQCVRCLRNVSLSRRAEVDIMLTSINGVTQQELAEESKRVWKFIIEREIEAPDRFQSIQTYRRVHITRSSGSGHLRFQKPTHTFPSLMRWCFGCKAAMNILSGRSVLSVAHSVLSVRQLR